MNLVMLLDSITYVEPKIHFGLALASSCNRKPILYLFIFKNVNFEQVIKFLLSLTVHWLNLLKIEIVTLVTRNLHSRF